MLGLDELKQTCFYQEAQREGMEQGHEQAFSLTIPALADAGLTPQQIAQRLQIDVTTIERFLNQAQNQSEK